MFLRPFVWAWKIIRYSSGLRRSILWLLLQPVVGPWLALGRWLYTREASPTSLVSEPANKEGPSESRLEMANPACPAGEAKPPSGLLRVIQSGSHIGYAFVVKTKTAGTVIVTAAHVFAAAIQVDGTLTLSNGEREVAGKVGKEVVPVRFSPTLDQVWLAVPTGWPSLLGAQSLQEAVFDPRKPITVFSPRADGATLSSTSMAGAPSPFRITYAASTVSGSSGSCLLQGGKVVGIHTTGRIANGAVRNAGCGLLGPVQLRETSNRAAGKAWQQVPMEEFEDFGAEEGFETIEDYLDLPAHKRGSRVVWVAHGNSYAAKEINASEKRLREKGAALWADEIDGAESAFQGAPQPAPAACTEGPIAPVPPVSFQRDGESSLSSEVRDLRRQLEGLMSRQASPMPGGSTACDPSPTKGATRSLKKRRNKRRPSVDGAPPTVQPLPSELQRPTRPPSEKKVSFQTASSSNASPAARVKSTLRVDTSRGAL
jgi:hypothetical protein